MASWLFVAARCVSDDGGSNLFPGWFEELGANDEQDANREQGARGGGDQPRRSRRYPSSLVGNNKRATVKASCLPDAVLPAAHS
jgi:hypothetical protein